MSVKYVEYLQGDSNSYIDTGIYANAQYKYELQFEDTSINNYENLFGSSVREFCLQRRVIESRFEVNYMGTNSGAIGTYSTTKTIILVDKNKIYCDNILIKEFDVNNNTTAFSNTTYLFDRNPLDVRSNAKVYYFKMWNENNELVLDFRPCLDDNNIPCMYDEVSGECFYNNGSGTFTHGGLVDALYLFADNNKGMAENLGSYRLYNMKIEGDSEGVESGVDYVDCLIGDGNSYIDTGIVVRNGYTIDLTFASTLDKYNQEPICGSGDVVGYTYDRFGGYGIGLRSYFVAVREIRDEASIDKNELEMTTVTFAIDEKVNFSHKFTNVNNNGSCLVMGQNYCDNSNPASPTYKTSNTVKLYDFKIYNDSNTLLIHLRPCVDTEGVPCMYDEVSGEYFKNQGTGTFGYKTELRDFQPVLDSNGIPCLMDKVNKKYYYDKNEKGFGCAEQNEYKRVSYIQGDGKSYINTNIIPTENIKIIVNGHFSQVKQYDTLFGGDGTKVQCAGNANQIYVYSGQSQHTHTYTNAVNIPHTYTLTHTQLKIDNDVLSLSSTGTIQNYSILLFGGWNKGVIEENYLSQGKVYYFKIYQSDELVFDGIPVLDSEGTPCMYDLVTKTFFYNKGTGEFSYGIEESECPPVNYVEYLSVKSSQQKYIHLEDIHMPSYSQDNISYEVKFKQLSEHGSVVGDVNVNVASFPCFNRSGGKLMIRFGRTITQFDYLRNDEVHTVTYNVNGGREVIANGVNLGTPSAPMEGFDHTAPIRLFYGYNNSHPSAYVTGEFYYFKIWDNGTLIHYVKPFIDDNGITGVYDEVTGKSYMREDIAYANTSYTPISYIESNGTQYINTGVFITDNTDIDMVYSNSTKSIGNIMSDFSLDNNTHIFNGKDTEISSKLDNITKPTLTLGDYAQHITVDEFWNAYKNGWNISGETTTFKIVTSEDDVSSFSTSETVTKAYIELTSANYKTRVDEVLAYYPNCTDIYLFDDGSITNLTHLFDTCSRKGQIEHVTFIEGYFKEMTGGLYCGFRSMTNLLTVNNIPNNITALELTFTGCSKLIDVNVPTSCISLYYTFQGCKALNKQFDFSELNLTDGKLSYTFDGCTSLSYAPILPNNYKGAIAYCFKNTALTQPPIIPEGVTDMTQTFMSCSKLTTPSNIPNSVTNMSHTFRSCSALTKMPTIPNSVTTMSNCFNSCTSLTEVTNIPNSVTDMSGCFHSCTKLTTAPTIGNKVTNMNGTFASCSALTTAPIIPNGVTNVSGTFSFCTSLIQAPDMPESVTNMRTCFEGCSNLESAIIPITSLPTDVTNYQGVFYGCRKLQNVTWKGEIDNNFNPPHMMLGDSVTKFTQEDIQELVPEHLKDLYEDEIKISFSNKKITINNTETTWEEE